MKKILYSLALVAIILGLHSCKKEPGDIEVGADLEQPSVYQNGKCYLDGEHFIYWESDDKIAVSNDWKDTVEPYTHASGTRETKFYGRSEHVDKVDLEAPCYAVYPNTSFVRTDDVDNIQISFPATMAYRNDYSFGKDAFPMVAYSTNPTTNGLGFHSVCGIARIQIFSTQVGTHNIDRIEFTEVGSAHGSSNKQISGVFTVNEIKKSAPYLSATDPSNNSIVISGINQSIGAATISQAKSRLLTFYLPLPATKANATQNLTTYILRMNVVSGSNQFSKDFKVDIRRNCITMLQAIDIDHWSPCDHGQANVHLVGCGTKERPFQIYTFNELCEVRDAFKNNGKINDQEITKDTYFRLQRTDIRLLTEEAANANDITRDANGVRHYGTPDHSQMNTCGAWTEGIPNFKGHFTCASNNPTQFGIDNRSHKPLFQSISAEGVVDSVTVRGGFMVTGTPIGDFSPFCLVNNGKMSNCVNQANITCNNNVAGVCFTNNGTITGCRNEGQLKSSLNVAGICMVNSANKVVNRCVGLATGILEGEQVGGLVHTNSGTVQSSYANYNNLSAKGDIGCIVYMNNSNGIVKNCYVSGSFATINPYSVGGICHTSAGSVTDCYNAMSSIKGSSYVGGIIAIMNGGSIQNCYLDGSTGGTLTTNNYSTRAGGFVGYMTAGEILNGYNVFSCYLGHSGGGDNSVGGCVGTINPASGETIRIWNVYASFNVGFVGSGIKATGVTIEKCYARSEVAGVGIEKITQTTDVPYRVYKETQGDLAGILRGNIGGDSRFRDWQTGNHPVFAVSAKRR